jgi:hypothetical protein
MKNNFFGDKVSLCSHIGLELEIFLPLALSVVITDMHHHTWHENDILLDQSHVHLIICYLWLLLC